MTEPSLSGRRALISGTVSASSVALLASRCAVDKSLSWMYSEGLTGGDFLLPSVGDCEAKGVFSKGDMDDKLSFSLSRLGDNLEYWIWGYFRLGT